MEVSDIIKPENQVFSKTCLMTDTNLSYCPGCGHGTAHNLAMEVIDEMGIVEDTIGVAPVGCSVLAYDFMNIDEKVLLLIMLLIKVKDIAHNINNIVSLLYGIIKSKRYCYYY